MPLMLHGYRAMREQLGVLLIHFLMLVVEQMAESFNIGSRANQNRMLSSHSLSPTAR